MVDLHLTFNEDVANYDKMRPTYPDELFDDVMRLSKLDSEKSALEIGIGTGQATLPILSTGCRVTAIEIGKDLAAFCLDKYSGYANFDIVNSDFESIDLINDSYDLIYSATAFHWIPPEIGYTKARQLLKCGGVLALFWNHPSRPEDDLHFAMQNIYDSYMPASEGKTRVHKFSDMKCLQIVDEIKQYGFSNVFYKVYYQTRLFDADGYIALLRTYSDHRALPAEKWIPFERELREAIGNNGGQVAINDTVDLYLSSKP